MYKSAIVTGATGFVGRALVKNLVHNGYRVTALVRSGSRESLSFSNEVEIAELGDVDKLARDLAHQNFDCFFHLAWAGVSGDMRANYNTQMNNIKMTLDACLLAKRLGCARFVASGSIMEHETLAVVNKGNASPGLGYIYGGAKLAVKTMCMPLATSLGIDYISGCLTNVYGIGDFSSRLISSTIRQCLRNISPEFTSANQIYDFIYVDDAAEAFRLIAEKGVKNTEYLIGSGQPRPLKEYLLDLQKVVAPELPFIFGAVKYTGVSLPNKIFDTNKIFTHTGFKTKVTFREGCRRTRDWLMSVL